MADDTPSVAEAFAKADAELTSKEESIEEESTDEVEETSSGSDEESEDESQQDEKESTKSDDEESDLEHIDPDKLPKELQPLYKNLMKGFTQGRQRDSEARKQAEEQVKQLEERLSKLEKGGEETPKSDGFQELDPETLASLTPAQQAQYFSSLAAYQARTQAKAEAEAARLESFREQALSDYKDADPRLKEGADSYDEHFDRWVGAALDDRLLNYAKEHGNELGFPYKDHLSELIEAYDDYMDSQIKKYIKKQDVIAKENKEKVKKLSPKTSKGASTPTKLGLGDSIKRAFADLAD